MLERSQAAIAAALLHGPGHIPAGLFAGDASRVLRGLRVHANTISHARLVALEETFPRTRAYLGAAAFNRLSRAFTEAGGAAGRSLHDIGVNFPDWLADPVAADLARVEQGWLASYNAAEARALELAELAGMGDAAVLALPLRLHPAARVVRFSSYAAPIVDRAFAPGTAALLVARPAAEVKAFALHSVAADALDRAKDVLPLGNLLQTLAEDHPDGGPAIAALIDAGAFERLGS